MQDLGSELDRLKYPFRKTGAIWSLQSQENYKAASWRSLPTVLYKHAFDVAMSIRKHHPQQEWESTASPRKRLPATWDGRWQRVSDGTIRTIDLGKAQHWSGLFDAQGNQIGRFGRKNAALIVNDPGIIATSSMAEMTVFRSMLGRGQGSPGTY
jgi:hypothetical protein